MLLFFSGTCCYNDPDEKEFFDNGTLVSGRSKFIFMRNSFLSPNSILNSTQKACL